MTEQTRNKLANVLMDAVEEDRAFTQTLKMLINIVVCQFGCTHQGVMTAMMMRLQEFQDEGEFGKKGRLMMTITVAEYRKLSEAIGAAFDSGASLSDVLRTVAVKHALRSQVTDADVLWSVQLIEGWAGDEVTKMKQDELNKNNG